PRPKIPPMPEPPSFLKNKNMGGISDELPPLKKPPVKSDKAPAAHDEKKDSDLPPVIEDDGPAAAPKAAPMQKDEFLYDNEKPAHNEPKEEDHDMYEYDGNVGELDPKVALAPMTSNRERAQRELREKIKMNDLQMEMEAPILDDLSSEYLPPEKKAKDLVEQDYLDRDEKATLRRRVQEDLSRVPESYNARQSKNMYNKLMEEKKIKIAKKGFALSVIPVLLGLAAAVLSFFMLGWGEYEQIFKIIAGFNAFGAVLLLIKSSHSRLFGITIYALSLTAYVGLSLCFYVYLAAGGKIPEIEIMHMIFTGAACAFLIAAIVMLTKSEAIITYYTLKINRKR
ncbi:MAG: hypothetical protein ILP19_04180, partial [Oscillospiraceae bacterium]|nr:hypothetical protein [Oscillospiraceae bacterium]